MRKRLQPAIELGGPLVGREVSCGIFPGLFDEARERGMDLETIVDGTEYPLTHYLDPTERVSWAAVQTICARLGEGWTEAELRAVGARSLDNQHFEPQVFLARMLLRPPEAYSFIIRGDTQGDFACLSAVTEIDGQNVEIEVTIADGYGHCPVLFSILAGAAEALPSLFKLDHASVDLSLHERGAHLSIVVPPGGGRWSWTDRLHRRHWRTNRSAALEDRLVQRSTARETEVAKRLTVEAELKGALAEQRRRLDNLNDVVVEIGLDRSVTFVSSNLLRVLGITELAFRRDPWLYLRPVDNGEEPSMSDLARPWIVEAADTGRWVEVNPSRYSDNGSSPLLLVIRDVTDRIEMAERLSGALRLESLGVMAAGVAHDFNNLLVPIAANAASLRSELDDESPLLGRIEAIERAVAMASQLSDQILTSTGQSIPEGGSCNVACCVRSMSSVLRGVVPPDVDLEFDLAASTPTAVDCDSVEKLVTNLVINAGQAIEGSGTVVVTVAEDGDVVRLRVSDDGVGMSPETAARITDPFFSGRPGGRGLGLASLAGLVQTGVAEFEVSTAVGAGTTITVSFDGVAGSDDKPASVAPATLPQADLSVLLIDDDDMVRAAIHRLLGGVFTGVHSVAQTAQAIDLLSADPQIDAVLIDLTMPDLRGPEAILQLRELRPELPVVMITGAGLAAARRELAEAGLDGVPVLRKPFSLVDVHDAVSGQLAGR